MQKDMWSSQDENDRRLFLERGGERTFKYTADPERKLQADNDHRTNKKEDKVRTPPDFVFGQSRSDAITASDLLFNTQITEPCKQKIYS